MILPVGARNFEEAMQMGSVTYHNLKVNNLSCKSILFLY
jgi:enolase